MPTGRRNRSPKADYRRSVSDESSADVSGTGATPGKRRHVRKQDQQEPRPVTAAPVGRPINAPRGLGYETDGTYIRRRGRP